MLPTALWPASRRPDESIGKRLLDMTIAFVLLLLLSPVFIAVSLLILCTSRGNILYSQKRVGKNGRQFDIFKFRTMVPNADQHGPSVTSSDDNRITPIGKMLRDNKLDELPQLFNVLRGDMSLVGPRPQVPRFVDHFEPSLRTIVLRVRPGMTGPTALYFRHEERILADQPDREGCYIENILPVKLMMDADYVLSRTLRYDLGILSKTISLFTSALLRRIFRVWKDSSAELQPTRAPYTLEEMQSSLSYWAITAEAAHHGDSNINPPQAVAGGRERVSEPQMREVSYDIRVLQDTET